MKTRIGIPALGLNIVCLFLALAFAMLAVGCRSTSRPDGAGFAAVDIAGRELAEIRAATIAVFRERGFDLPQSDGRNMVFEKQGTRGDLVTYGGWFDKTVWIRVRVSITPLPTGLTRLACETWMVREPGDRRFEEEQKLSRLRSRPYQELLEEVARRTAQP